MKTLTPSAGETFDTGSHFPALTHRALDEELATISDDDLESSIVALKRHIDASQTHLLVRIAEYHRRDLAQVRHLLGTVGWMRKALRLTSGTAARMLRSARTLIHMPDITEAASDGRITPDGVRLLTDARKRHPEAFTEHQGVFTEIAQYLSVDDLRVAIEHWEQQIDYPDTIARVKHQRERRRLNLSKTFEGMWRLDAILDPETGTTVAEAIQSIVGRQNVAASRAGSHDRRQPWQRRADALGDIADFWLKRSDEVGTSGGSKPHITVTTTLETLLGFQQGIPRIDDLMIDPSDLRRISCDAGIVRIIVDPDDQPLSVGRKTRTIPSAIRRALDYRDKGCVHNGCNAPASWCDAHHIIHWADLGRTELDNLQLLCRTHHRAAHRDDPEWTPP